MLSEQAPAGTWSGTSQPITPADAVREALAHAGHFLPDQGPIGVFVHHNTLHAFAHQPFHEAVARAAALFGAEPYMSEEAFRRCHARGRIDDQDIAAAIAAGCPDDPLVVDRPAWSLRRRELRRLAMLHPIAAETPTGLRYRLEEEALASDPLWTCCRQLAAPVSAAAPARALPGGDDQTHGQTHEQERRHRHLLLDRTGEDIDHLINPMLIRFCAAFLDLGMSYWPMPDRDQGFYPAVRAHLTEALLPFPGWMHTAVRAFRDQRRRGHQPMDVICAALDDLGVGEQALAGYLTELLLALPGWAGMMHRLERHPADRPPDSPPAALIDFVAVRLVLEQAAIRHLAHTALERRPVCLTERNRAVASSARRDEGVGFRPTTEEQRRDAPQIRDFATEGKPVGALGWDGPLAALLALLIEQAPPDATPADHAADHAADHDAGDADHAYRLYRLLRAAQVPADRAAALDHADARALLAELDAFDALARRRTFQEAYERQHRRMILDALAAHRPHARADRPPAPRFQVITCLDERQESLRRHLEELEPAIETLGTAGFFGVAMDFRGIDDAHHVPLCPVVQTPAHEIDEHPHEDDRHLHARRVARRRLWARLARGLSIGSRTLVRGQVLTLALGSPAALAMAGRVLFPRATARLRRRMAAWLLPRPRTMLRIARTAEAAAEHSERGKLLGFTAAEKTERVAALLADMGLTDRFAPLVLVLGHGSTSHNNPHASAYDCGACGGRRGGNSARMLAEMANRPEVRAGLRDRGIQVPDSTWFVGGMHDTTSDVITLYDTDRVPAHLHAELHQLTRVLERARMLDAHERCRRFESAGRAITPAQALRHVEARAEHLAEPRAECGHATNAVCIVGRRALTRGLFLDRRAFLVSYDPAHDADGWILARTLAAVTPVGAGINLEYYFSFVDNERYGCGTKLPHNITGLLGVMNGHASDLRTGLPWQMVEIHEPVRLLTIVEASPARLLLAAERQPDVRAMVENRWIQLVSLDPDTGAMQVFGDHGFEPYAPAPGHLPVVASSMDWYRGHIDHLPPARIAPDAHLTPRKDA